MIPVLRDAMKADPKDARAPYYLGNLLYDWQPEKAKQSWTDIIASDTTRGQRMRARFAEARQVQRYFVALSQKKREAGVNVEDVFRELCDTARNTAAAPGSERDYQFIRENTIISADSRAYPHYLAGLGYLGMGNKAKAKEEMNAALRLSPDFLSAKIELNLLD